MICIKLRSMCRLMTRYSTGLLLMFLSCE